MKISDLSTSAKVGAGVAGTTIVGLVVTGIWALLGGGLDAYVDGRVGNIVTASQTTVDGTSQEAKLNELTAAVGALTTAIEGQETLNGEFRNDVRGQLRNLNLAILNIAGAVNDPQAQ